MKIVKNNSERRVGRRKGSVKIKEFTCRNDICYQTRAASGIFEVLWCYAAPRIEAKLFVSK